MARATFWTAMELWERRAETRGFSPKTILNTRTQLKMLGSFVDLGASLEKFSAERYESVLGQMVNSHYSRETVYDLNATLRKLLNLAVSKRLVRRNVLTGAENLRVEKACGARVIPFEDFEKIAMGVRRVKYKFLFTLLYYTGIRIGEALALAPEDFFEADGILRVKIAKSYLADFKVVKSTKNGKVREIPLSKSVVGEFLEFYGARSENAKIFDFSPQMARRVLGETCEKLGLPRYRLHEFRHTFVSNLIRAGVPLPVVANVSGDLQTTLLKRYSHMFPNDEKLILEALSRGFGDASGHAAKPTRYPAPQRLLGLIDQYHELYN